MIKASMGKITQIKANTAEIGESIEERFQRILNNNEIIRDGAPLIFTERNEGTLPAYDIRTDRFEIAVEGMDAVDKSIKAKREEKAKSFALKIAEDEPINTRQENQ